MEAENAKVLSAKGELSDENTASYEKLRKSFDQLLRGVSSWVFIGSYQQKLPFCSSFYYSEYNVQFWTFFWFTESYVQGFTLCSSANFWIQCIDICSFFLSPLYRPFFTIIE